QNQHFRYLDTVEVSGSSPGGPTISQQFAERALEQVATLGHKNQAQSIRLLIRWSRVRLPPGSPESIDSASASSATPTREHLTDSVRYSQNMVPNMGTILAGTATRARGRNWATPASNHPKVENPDDPTTDIPSSKRDNGEAEVTAQRLAVDPPGAHQAARQQFGEFARLNFGGAA
ncbi:MAG: hypothetical protein ACRCZI_05840, partial [Cetobacterium sp.]